MIIATYQVVYRRFNDDRRLGDVMVRIRVSMVRVRICHGPTRL